MGRDRSREGGTIANALDDAGDVGGTIEHAHLAGDADEGVDDGLVVGNHVLVVVGGRALQRVGGAAEEVAPERRRDELEERQDAGGALGRRARAAVQEEVEEAQPQRVPLLR